MVCNVVDFKGNVIGCSVGNYFIPVEYHFYICKPQEWMMKTIRGSYKDGILRCGNSIYFNVVNCLDSGHIDDVFKTFKQNGVLLQDIIYAPSNICDLDCDNLSSIWSSLNNSKVSNNLYTVYKSEKPVAYLLVSDDLYSSKDIYILMLETFNKGTGVGTAIVNSLKGFYKKISGLSVVTAEEFWIKQGAIFKDKDMHFSIK